MGLSPLKRRQIALVTLATMGAVFLYIVRGILFPFWLAIILAYLSNPAVMELERREVPRNVAIVLVYLVLIVGFGLSGYYLIPKLITELDQVVMALPKQTQELSRLGDTILTRLERAHLPIDFPQLVEEGIDRVEVFLNGFFRRLLDLVLASFSRLFSIFLAPFLAFYILRDWDTFQKQLRMLIPVAYRSQVEDLAGEINHVLSGFIRGQLIVSAVVGGILTLGFTILGVRFALLLGLLAGVFNIIPYFGPLIGALPAIVLALLDSPWKVAWIGVLFLLVNTLESSVVAPRILGGRVGLHPLAIIFAILAGGHLFGVVGMLLAVPVAAVGRITASFLFHHFLG